MLIILLNWDKHKAFAKIPFLKPNAIIKVKQRMYTHQHVPEFDKQTKELLDNELIRNRKIHHISPAFIIEIMLKKKGEMLEWYSIVKSLIIILSLIVIVFLTKISFQ